MAARLCSSHPPPPPGPLATAPLPPPELRPPTPTPMVSMPRAAVFSTHSNAISWHSPSSILGRSRGYPPAMRMYAWVHSCARIAPAHTAGRPYRTTTALTTVAPRD